MSKHTYRHPRESQGLLPQFLFMKINIPMDLDLLLLRKYQLHSTELYKHVRTGAGRAWWMSYFEEVPLRFILLQLRTLVWDLSKACKKYHNYRNLERSFSVLFERRIDVI